VPRELKPPDVKAEPTNFLMRLLFLALFNAPIAYHNDLVRGSEHIGARRGLVQVAGSYWQGYLHILLNDWLDSILWVSTNTACFGFLIDSSYRRQFS
jgi:hypothetical protein